MSKAEVKWAEKEIRRMEFRRGDYQWRIEELGKLATVIPGGQPKVFKQIIKDYKETLYAIDAQMPVLLAMARRTGKEE